MKAALKKILPRFLLLAYHRGLATLADFYYQHPSRTLIVIGVTGTKGKTTTAYLIAKLLEAGGYRTGLATTALFKIGPREWLNASKMTMLGRFRLQRLLRDMVRDGVTHAVIEVSSEGILQNRHRGIWFDCAVFTNLTPDHLESHGSFEAYRAAKGDLFRAVMAHPAKRLGGRTIQRTIVVNENDENASYFTTFPSDRILKYVTQGLNFEEKNAAAATAVVGTFGVDATAAARLISSIPSVPGRFERIDAGQPFTVIVDYAHEAASFHALYERIRPLDPKWIIHVFGATGGGRDKARRPEMGRIAAEHADTIIITTDDPYDDDPQSLADDVMNGIPPEKRRSARIILDRGRAIAEAVRLATPGDLVLITGKGSEQTQVLARGRIIPWDDRAVTREAIKKIWPTSPSKPEKV